MIVLFRPKEKLVTPLKERIGAMALGSEWLNTKKSIEGYQEQMEKNPDDAATMIKLAQAYYQEGRVTGDHMYYDGAALKLLNKILEKKPDNFEAMATKAAVYLSQHHFSDGLVIAKQAQQLNPYNAFVYGLLVDANVELGNYTEAIKMSDKMNEVRPDIRSYSRVSYIREIFGDYAGAIEAMKYAVSAGYPGMEQTEWCRVMLGHLYEQTGDLKNAQIQYETANAMRGNYAYALAGLGRIAVANKNYNAAIKYFTTANDLVVDYAFGDELIDLYRLNNEPIKANETAMSVLALLNKDAQSANDNATIGHYSDKELAMVYLKVNDYDKALEHAFAEYNRRPDNIDVSETLAWVQYKKKDYAEALKHIQVAMKTNSQNPILLCHAGLIYIENHNEALGIQLINKAVAQNPFLDPMLMKEVAPYITRS